MIADISHGHVDAADALFLVAVILFGLATLINLLGETTSFVKGSHTMTAVFAGLTSLALAWLLL